MFVIGIDPGLSRCGYCVVEPTRRGATTRALGVMRTPHTDDLPERLAALQTDLIGLFDEHPPAVLAVERVFFQVNVRTAMAVGQASGLAIAEAARRGAVVVQYTPNQVKEAVTGDGAATKAQVAEMVQQLLGLTTIPKPADASDAAALALCHLAHAPRGISKLMEMSR